MTPITLEHSATSSREARAVSCQLPANGCEQSERTPKPIADFLAEAARRGLSDAQCAEAIGMSATTISRVRRGIYEGDLAAVADKAALALRLWHERGNKQRFLVETSIATKLFTACDFALNRQTPVVITGESQIGKTTAFEEYARRSDAIVRYVRMPASANLPLFLEELADALGVASRPGERRRRILAALNDRTLLIIDEVHELAHTASREQAKRICEVIRECYDRTRCGLVLCGTDDAEKELLHGPDAGALAQIVRRSINVRLGNRIPLPDALKVAAYHGLTLPPTDEAKAALRGLFLNHINLISAMAAEAAAKRAVPLDWPLWLATKRALLGD